MRIKLPLIGFILFTLTFSFLFSSPKLAFADNFTLSGSVKDASGNAISGATVNVNDTNNDNTTTDSSGNYTLSIPQGTYNVQVTPPAGSNFSSAVALSQNISANTVLNFVLVASGSVQLRGHVRDSLGNAVAGQTVKLIATGGSTTSNTSDASGNYTLTVSPATYQSLVVTADHNGVSLDVAQHYQLIASNYSLTQSTMVDLIIPAKKVDFHVQDASGNSVSGVTIKASLAGGLTQNLSIGGSITAAGESSYGVTGTTTAVTDTSGNTTVWLTPTGSSTSYTFVATPPNGSGQVTTTVSNVTFTSDTQQTITLPQPVTLSGHVYDSLGNSVSGQTVQLIASGGGGTFSTTSNASGIYSFTVAPGTYQAFVITADNNSSSVNLSQHYKLIVSNYSLTQNTTADITVPVKKVTVHIQDAAGNSVSNVSVKATIPNGLIQNLSIGSSITAAGESSYGVTATSPKTDSSGNVILWLLPTDANTVYNITATPPGGSGFQTTTLSNVTFNSDTQETITLQQPVTLSGHVYDSLGNPLANQTVTLISSGGNRFNATTNTSGIYLLNVSAATYQTLLITTDNNSFSLNAPQHYQLIASNYSLTQNTTADITVPGKKVTVHVQDQLGNPVSSIGVKALITNGLAQGLSIGSNITAAGESSYGVTGSSPQTDSSGNVILWLLPNDANSPYAFTATPPNGSIYSTFTLSNITVSGDQTELISLQYSHNPATTTATLSPAPDNQGKYSNPTTVTLSAAASSGYTVTNTYYTRDGGTLQTYSSPFTVTGNGSHTITYWSVDNSGVTETHNSKTFTILATYSLSGTVYNDANQNGFQDTGEAGFTGATVTLDSGQTATTDANGNYSFLNVPAGTYVETLTIPNGYTATTTNPANISLAANTTQNFGIIQNNSLVTAINTGGDTEGNFIADTDFSGGTQYSSSASVDTSGVSNPAPEAVYKTVRYGNFSYTIPNLTPNANYTIKLHFNELYWGTDGNDATGKRVFNVSVNGTQVLSNYDIYAKAGGTNKAIVEQLPVTADSNGNVAIQFATVVDNAMVNGIELYNGTLPTPTPTATPTPASSALINAGGNTAGNFAADKNYVGGQPYTSSASVDISTVTNPAPQSVYQSVRYGNFTYTIPNLQAGANYLVRLHFNELYWNNAGSRVFNVKINGSQVLTNYDIFQQAGGENKAVVEEFIKPADSNGKIAIQFVTVTDNAMVNGIELIEQ
ncbi:MAG TPA: malectin domain-containing carbohydrate-binding protein [Candidatus Saccharimonadales bacterium]|nr:malectin domain-containing carbohydrate-binding protein [Candidatus Saccharimonadales bacterium]